MRFSRGLRIAKSGSHVAAPAAFILALRSFRIFDSFDSSGRASKVDFQSGSARKRPTEVATPSQPACLFTCSDMKLNRTSPRRAFRNVNIGRESTSHPVGSTKVKVKLPLMSRQAASMAPRLSSNTPANTLMSNLEFSDAKA